MDLVIGMLWFSAFSVIVIFLGALNYFLGRTSSDIKQSQTDTTNQQQSTRTSNNRRKHARNANKKRQQAAATALKNTLNNDDKQEIKSISSDLKNKEEEEESHSQLTDEEQEQKEEFEDPLTIEEVLTPSIQEEQKPIKQRNKNKNDYINGNISHLSSSILTNSTKEESNLLTKPQASVAPVKQSFPINSTINIESTQISQDKNSKSNGTSSHNLYSYSEQNSLPPGFQQRQQKEINDLQNFRKRKSKKPLIPPNSTARQNDFIPSKQQIELPLNQNGYSSESDVLTESSSTAPPLSTESQFSLKRSLSPSNNFLDELVSIFDTTSFSTDELQLILNKISTKHLLNKQDRQRITPSSSTTTTITKNERTMERILDETYRSQAKILSIELQTEKHRVLELSKINADMDTAIRQLQQPNNNMLPYQQTILSYQMQIKRIADDNARLAHQLHAYSIMPQSINELKQQEAILNEQLRQLTMRNSNLEQEIDDGERASKHAAEIYKKADTQKQERIEQLLTDINKYKKIEKDLITLQAKHKELEKHLKKKLHGITDERDDLQKSCDQLKGQVHQYEQSNISSDQTSSNLDQLQEELNEVKSKNDLLRQRNWKIMEQLNKLKSEQQS